jgi:hypothetical protein
MKKFVLALGLLAALGAFVFAQANLPRLAVVEFTTNNNADKTKQDAVTVRNLTESQMVSSGKYQIISRSDIDKLLENQQIQISAISSAENVKKLQLQNISYIVTGSVDAMGGDYAVTVKILDVSTGQFSHSANDFMGGGSRELYTGVNSLVSRFVAGMSESGGQVVQAPSAAPNANTGKVYKVGEFGPAGGIVFYDKGVFSGGWRYLEAAPSETEFTAQWGAYQKDVSGTGTAIGAGKRNTQVIADYLRQTGESGRAAQLCASLDFDGYKDWFLPSKDELNLMYTNLKQKGLGSFQNNWYWSSSQDGSNGAWGQGFSDGGQVGYDGKSSTDYVRPIRAF